MKHVIMKTLASFSDEVLNHLNASRHLEMSRGMACRILLDSNSVEQIVPEGQTWDSTKNSILFSDLE